MQKTNIMFCLCSILAHTLLLTGPKADRSELPGSEGGEPAQPGVWQRQEVQRQQRGKDNL